MVTCSLRALYLLNFWGRHSYTFASSVGRRGSSFLSLGSTHKVFEHCLSIRYSLERARLVQRTGGGPAPLDAPEQLQLDVLRARFAKPVGPITNVCFFALEAAVIVEVEPHLMVMFWG